MNFTKYEWYEFTNGWITKSDALTNCTRLQRKARSGGACAVGGLEADSGRKGNEA